MRLENLGNMVWKCCLIEEDDRETYNDKKIIEISGNKEEYQNEDNFADDRKIPGIDDDFVDDRKIPRIDDDLVDILDELYCIKGLEKIYSTRENGKEVTIECLKELSGQYTALLKFRQFYYKEVQESINKINHYTDNDVERVFFHWRYIRNLEIFYTDLLVFKYFNLGRFYYIVDSLWNFYNVSPKLFEDIISKMDKLLIYNYKNQRYNHKEKTIELCMNLMKLFRNDAFGMDGEVIWLVFLCNLAQFICIDDYNEKNGESEHIDSVDGFIRKLNQLIVKTTEIVDESTTQRIIGKQRDLLMCYQIHTVNKELFDIKAKQLLHAIKSDDQLKKRYLNGKGCIALMHYGSRRFVAISGNDSTGKQQKSVEKILKMLPPNYINVSMNDKVRFYYDEKQFITCADYKKWWRVNKDKIELLDGCVNRMFSCCERKLLTEICDSCNTKFEIYVKKKPCVFCEDALNAMNNTIYSNVYYIKNEKGNMEKRVIKYLKRLGKQIDNNETPINRVSDKS